ncbi:capsule assembly Wzi family protein [Pedobacter sp. MC2016-24]|uniref:capsule assembly Wzi family protein n=1 Tax=Pedobacter sp. MC2016-24 TaxID=2780090 RepID=UPI001881CE62|nr:capsule assembly Wzi family protein [Pedobacter sp. MC2016-24]MBE9599529.1 hypothetical protein [Pedobacter sp. MC2016-24]
MHLKINGKFLNKRLLLFFIMNLVVVKAAFSQKDVIHSQIETQVIGTTDKTVPFWLRSNTYGSLPSRGLSTSFIGRLKKDFDMLPISTHKQQKMFDFGYGLEARANIGYRTNLNIIQAYAKLRLSIFQLTIGRTTDVMGFNGDTTLSSGNFSVSGNALGIPKIDISIPEFYRLPLLEGLFSVKGNFVHGWSGKTRVLKLIKDENGKESYNVDDYFADTYLHQKSLYVRFGKQDWKLNLIGGFNHQVQWDDQKVAFGDDFKLSSLQTFFYVVTGKAYGGEKVARSKIGNQLGSIDLGAEFNYNNNLKFTLYRQNIYDVGALSKLANIRDGLNGITIENKNFYLQNRGLSWKKILIEYFYTKDQAGYPWSIPTASGDEDYYNNYYYRIGWSYKRLGLGNPFITPATNAREGQAHDPFDYFINNRVIAWHIGFLGAFNAWDLKLKLSYSDNYGTFGTSPYGKSTGGKYSNPVDLFKTVGQFSMLYETGRSFHSNLYGGATLAFDKGSLLNNSVGIIIKVRKSFN